MLTLVILPGLKWSLSYRSIFHGCGEHDGLVIAADVDVSPDFQRRAMVDAWNKDKAPGRRATLVEIARSTDATRSQLAAALASGSCAYDVLLVDTAWFPEYAQRGFLAEIKSSWLDEPSDFIPQIMKTGQWHERQYAVPWFTDAGLLYVRRGEAAPSTWDELLRQGYATQLKNYEGLTVNALEVIWNTQRRTVLSDAIDSVDENIARVVLQGLEELAGGGAALSGSRAYGESESIEAFIGGQAFMRNWPYAFRELTADPRIRTDFAVKSLPEPLRLSVLGGWHLAVSAHSRHQDEAVELIRFLTSATTQRELFHCGGFTPSRVSAFTDPKPCSDPKYSQDEQPSPEQFREFATTLQAALFNARPRPVTPYYAQFSETFRGCVVQVLNAHAGLPGASRPTPHKLSVALTDALRGRHGSC
ncbi:MAG TPA: extracellular solute-binding protein [Streptosporangiaceae bacterium]|nr:extracellular solute-binding protein [Streptosporangiaceae bacterium]